MLLISDADDDKIEWVIEAVKAFLPQSANNQYLDYSFDYEGRYEEYGHRKMERLELTNILKLPNSRFTPSGFNHFCCKLYQRKMLYTKILFQSPFIESNAEEIFVSEYNLTVQCLPMDHNFFTKVFEDFPIIE